MRETKVKSVRALERGLLVLETIKTLGSVNLAELHNRTSLPRATILRSLRTLQESGWITSRGNEAEYRPGPKLGGATAPSKVSIADLSAPVLQKLTKAVNLPADVAVRRGTRMLIIQSSRHLASFPINARPEGRQPCLLRSALGRAYLAFCPDDERKQLINLLEQSTDPDDRPAGVRKWVDRMLAECRQQGYGVREADYWAGAEDFGAEVSAIAVPIKIDERVIACVNLMWATGTKNARDFAQENLPALRAAADDLALACKQKPSSLSHTALASP
jgi:IclR family mhp operon transcriptional activator